jgi:arginine/lysine/ornithine decarboxylase
MPESWPVTTSAAAGYLEDLLPPFFKALAHHAERSAESWHTPGHAGGVGFMKSPWATRCTSSLARTRCARLG